MLELENITVKYKSKKKDDIMPISEFTFVAKPGELVVIIGNSGAGKSTFLDVVAGFIRKYRSSSFLGKMFLDNSESVSLEGKVLLDGRDITFDEPRLRDVGLVMQHFSLYEHMNVRKNLEFPLKMKNVKEDEMKQLVDLVAKNLDINGVLGSKISNISGGEKQRIAIGKLVLKNPKVALLDEAFSNLDFMLKKELMNIVVNQFLRQEDPKCVLYVTHDLSDAIFADRIIVFNKNKEKNQLGKTEIKTFPDENNRKGITAWEDLCLSGIYDITDVRFVKNKKE